MNLLYDVKGACELLCIGRTNLFAEIKRGRLSAFKRGAKNFFHRDELERYAAALRSSEPASVTRLDVSFLTEGGAGEE